jgi:hypothetical protein
MVVKDISSATTKFECHGTSCALPRLCDRIVQRPSLRTSIQVSRPQSLAFMSACRDLDADTHFEKHKGHSIQSICSAIRSTAICRISTKYMTQYPMMERATWKWNWPLIFAKRDSAFGKREKNPAMKFLYENAAIQETFGGLAFGISVIS